MKWIIPMLLPLIAQAQDYALDDVHNHDGTHVEGQDDCGTNYLLPGEKARLGSHSFIILGEDGADHILADHRSGTPPHTYQYILRVRLDPDEMTLYRKLRAESKQIPAFTTIFYDDQDPKKQLDRTFFCNQDLPSIFGAGKKNGDKFAKLFPIRASLQKDADFEGAFEIAKSIYPGGHLTIERSDVELIVFRYLPTYLEQQTYRKALKERPEVARLVNHAPLYASEPVASASKRLDYASTDGAIGDGGECPKDFYLKKARVPRTIHTFLLMAESGPNEVLAVHYYDMAPHNFQTVMNIKLSAEEMKIYRDARVGTSILPMLQTRVGGKNFAFCMADLKKLAASPGFRFEGTIFRASGLNDYKAGAAVGKIEVDGKDLRILTNRNLLSLMNPRLVAADVLGKSASPFVDLKTISPATEVEMRYASEWNFMGRPVTGYLTGKCLLSEKAAHAIARVQAQVQSLGLGLLIFDCYRPQPAVDAFMKWTRDAADSKMKSLFYPEEPKDKLVERGYIADKSGHSRGSTVDLTLISAKKSGYREKETTDCRAPRNLASTGQLDMGTTFDCFSTRSNTADASISSEAKKNRAVLKQAMEKAGFVNYPKEWWHFTLKDEPFKDKFFDLPVQ